MKTTILTIALFVFTLGTNAQDFYSKKYKLGLGSTGKWYKLFDIDLNGGGNFNSVDIKVDCNYVATALKYNSSAYIRLREGVDESFSDWQNNATGIRQEVLKFKKTGISTYELWGYSVGSRGHLSFECRITKEAGLIINIPEDPIIITDVNLFEDVPNVKDRHYSKENFNGNEETIGIENAKLLQKIEELTLCNIDQLKQLKELQLRLEQVEAKN